MTLRRSTPWEQGGPLDPEEPIEIATISVQMPASAPFAREKPKMIVVTKTKGDLTAGELEAIQLIAKGAELAANGATRDEISKRLQELQRVIGEQSSTDPYGTGTAHAKLTAIGNSLVAIRESVGTLAERRIRRAETRAKGAKK